MTALRFINDPDQLAGALSPIRRRILAALTDPTSATELAPALGLTRQKINYHLHVLERLGLVELVELRRRRGCVERVLRRSGEFVVDPGMVEQRPAGRRPSVAERDRHAAEHLIAAAGNTVRQVARMQAAAEQRGRRLLTFTVETEVAFAEPVDVHRFTDDLAAALALLVERYSAPGGRAYAVTVCGHPALADPASPPEPGGTA